MDPSQIQGLPPGATLSPLPPASQIQGMPAGATLAPMGAAASPDTIMNAVAPKFKDEDSLPVQTDEAVQGFKKGVNQTGETAMHIIHALPGVGALLDKTKFNDSLKETTGYADAPIDTLAGKSGYGLENIIEFMAGDELLKELSLGEKLTKIAPILKVLEKYPRLQDALHIGIRQGAVGGTEALGHGDTPGQAAASAAVTGGAGGAAELAIPAVGQGIKNLIEKIRPGTAEIAGETVPVLASQKPGAKGIATKVTTDHAPAVAEAQQEGGQAAVKNIAQRATRNALDKVNAVRRTAPITDPSRMLSAPADAKPFEFHIEGPAPEESVDGSIAPEGTKNDTYIATGGRKVQVPNENFRPGGEQGSEEALGSGAHTAPVRSITGGATKTANNWMVVPPEAGSGAEDVARGGGKLVTQDPKAAQAALSRLEDLAGSEDRPASQTFKDLPKEQQQQVTAARDSLREQLGMYHAGDGLYPHFDPVDTKAAIEHVGDFGEAADQIEASVKPIYQKLDQVSEGKFTALRAQAKAATKVMFAPGSVEAYEKALASKGEAEQGIQELFNRHSGSVSRPELQSANTAWRDASTLNTIHATVEGAFRGAPKDIADTLGTNRILRGNSLETRLNRMLQKTPQADIERVIGKDGLENLYRVSHLLSKPETAVGTQNAIKQIAKHLTRAGRGAAIGGLLGHIVGVPIEGALAGAGAEDAVRYVFRQAAINPRIGILIDRAVRHNVDPKIFAPLIAASIEHGQDETQEEGKP